MRVVDPSVIGHPGFPNGVEILFFAPREADLPRPGCVDHIIRLHRCTVRNMLRILPYNDIQQCHLSQSTRFLCQDCD